MANLGTYEYPKMTISKALEIAKQFEQKLDGKSSIKTFAEALGHTNMQSGTFIVKMAELRKYGIVEGRGDITLSQATQIVLHPKNEAEFDEKLKELFFKVELWKKVYDRLKGNMPTTDFWITLCDISGVDRNTAQKQEAIIRKLYIDFLTKLHTGSTIKSPQGATMQIQEQRVSSQNPQSEVKTIGATIKLDVDTKDLHLTYPLDESSIDIIKSSLDYLKKKMKEEKTDEGKSKG